MFSPCNLRLRAVYYSGMTGVPLDARQGRIAIIVRTSMLKGETDEYY